MFLCVKFGFLRFLQSVSGEKKKTLSVPKQTKLFVIVLIIFTIYIQYLIYTIYNTFIQYISFFPMFRFAREKHPHPCNAGLQPLLCRSRQDNKSMQ